MWSVSEMLSQRLVRKGGASLLILKIKGKAFLQKYD